MRNPLLHPRSLLLVAVLAGLALAGGGCTSASAKSKPGPASGGADKLKPVNVKVRPLRATTLQEHLQVTGVTAADADIVYSAQIAGEVEVVGVDVGDRVRRGQLLARIDYRSLRAMADQAAASHELARKTHQRVSSLAEKKVITRQQLDEATSRLVIARAQLRIARANLAKSQVRAKQPGVVVARHVERGEYVGPGAPMLQVVDHRTIVVHGRVPERQVAAIRPGSAARVHVRALDQTFDGRVDVVVPVADPASKTFEVRIEVPNPGREIMVGMAVTARMPASSRRQVLLASQDVVLEGRDGRSVFVASGGVARRRPVKLGPTRDQQVVLEQGVSEGERLVVLGHRELRDGQPVRIVN
jgi:membrane fusion protein (multidrug efflux system)